MNSSVYYAFLLREREKERLKAEADTAFASGGPIQPRKPTPVAPSSTATVRPVNPFVMQQDRQTAIQAQVAANTPVLKPTGYVPEGVKQKYAYDQKRKELEDKALTIADGASMTLPVPIVGETVGVLGAGVSAGIRGARAINDVQQGNYLSAANNAGNVLAGLVLPGMMKKGATVFKQRQAVDGLIKNPSFPPSLATQQAEADAGAEWARDWFKKRAESSMGGLTPADAPMSQAIKRPVVPDVPTWKAMGNDKSFPGKTRHGVYYPAPNVATVSPTTLYPQSFAVHEVTHQFQNAARNTPAMKQGMAAIRQELPALNTPSTAYDRYWARPDEVHARLNQLRHELGYRPDEIITRERLVSDLKKHADSTPQPGNYAVDYFNVNRVGIDNTVNWLNKLPAAVPLGVFGAGALAGIKKRPGE